MSSRDRILGKLRAAQQPFTEVKPFATRQHMVPVENVEQSALKTLFIREAETVGCFMYICETDNEAVERILEVIGGDLAVSAWELPAIGVSGLETALERTSITVSHPKDDQVRVGLTGVDYAVASTASLILMSGEGKYRTPSLLPPLHLAVVRTSQIVADFETWTQMVGVGGFNKPSNITVVTGPSKTADIAQELILGAHGPKEVHIILIDDIDDGNS